MENRTIGTEGAATQQTLVSKYPPLNMLLDSPYGGSLNGEDLRLCEAHYSLRREEKFYTYLHDTLTPKEVYYLQKRYRGYVRRPNDEHSKRLLASLDGERIYAILVQDEAKVESELKRELSDVIDSLETHAQGSVYSARYIQYIAEEYLSSGAVIMSARRLRDLYERTLKEAKYLLSLAETITDDENSAESDAEPESAQTPKPGYLKPILH